MPPPASSVLGSGTRLVHRLREAMGVTLAFCDQCGTCTAVCPASGAMDLTPSRLVRLVQAGFEGFDRRVLASQAIWLCTGCDACARRCPQQVDLPKAMAFFQHEAECLGLVRPQAGAVHFGGGRPGGVARAPLG